MPANESPFVASCSDRSDRSSDRNDRVFHPADAGHRPTGPGTKVYDGRKNAACSSESCARGQVQDCGDPAILFIPGAEGEGFLAYPASSIKSRKWTSREQYVRLIKERGGNIFLSHVEEKLDWPVQGLDGIEIYNHHTDVKDESIEGWLTVDGEQRPWIYSNPIYVRQSN